MATRIGFAVVVVGAALFPQPAAAQFVTIAGSGSYSQDFNSFPLSGSIPFNQGDSPTPTLAGWYAVRTVAGAFNLVANEGGSNAGNLYNYGAVNNGDRALGTIGSGSVGNFAYGVVIRNVGTGPVTVTVTYTGEQWRFSGDAVAQTVDFSYRVAPSGTTVASTDFNPGAALPTGFTNFDALDFTSPTISGPTGALNPPGTQTFTNVALTGVQVGPNEYLYLRWYDPNHAGNDHGLAIDDLTVTFTPVPEPGTVLGVAAVGLGLIGAARRLRRRTTPA